jgi:hypothetical protein
MMRSKSYWAAEPLEDMLPEAWERIDAYYRHIEATGLLTLWRAAWNAVFPALSSSGSLGTAGNEGELVTVDVNETGNLETHVVTMITGQRVYPEARAKNADYRSQIQTIVGNGLAETALREKGLERVLESTARRSVRYGEAYVLKNWDRSAGPDFVPDDDPMDPEASGAPLKSGDVKYRSLNAIDVVRDVNVTADEPQRWYITRTYANRYDLLATHPEWEEEILAAPSKREMQANRPLIKDIDGYKESVDSDHVPVWTLYHAPTPALPNGRMTTILSPKCALEDEVLVYREIPVYRMAPADVDDASMGYSGHFDILPLQAGLNAVVSAAISNQAAFGVQSVWFPDGCKAQKTQIGQGLSIFEGGQNPPQPLNLLSTPAETFKLVDLLGSFMEKHTGVNPVVRGNPEANLKSGTALALVQAQAIQFVALTQKAYIQCTERVLTATVHDYQDFGNAVHTISVAGLANESFIHEFTSGDIKDLDRVTVSIGNPLQGTIAGRTQMVEGMGQMGLIQTPEQYIQVVTTGRIEPVIEGSQKELLNIRKENERMSRAVPAVAVFTDNHPVHMREHSSVLASPEARENPAVIEAVMTHILGPGGHAELWRGTDPALLMALEIAPPPPDPALMMEMGMDPNAPPGDGKPGPEKKPGVSGGPRKPGEAPMPGGIGAQGAKSMGLKMPGQPQMPKNPSTGQRYAGPIRPQ